MESSDSANAAHLLRVARRHPECLSGAIVSDTEVQIDLKVEMPLHLQDEGVSDTGVRAIETVTLSLPNGYPWQSPVVSFRSDFPRSFPHLMPGSLDSAPRPCLIDGDQDEFFLQFGLVDYGIFHLCEQVAVWLRKAAQGVLIDPLQGWEPMMRRGLVDVLAFDASAARRLVSANGGYAVWRATFARRGDFSTVLNQGASTWIESDADRTPLNRADDTLFTASKISAGIGRGNSIVGLVWPDKMPSGAPVVADRYWPEDVLTLHDLTERAKAFGCWRGLNLLLDNLKRCFQGRYLNAVIPVGIVLCVRRPCALIGEESAIELLPYVMELRPASGWTSLMAQGEHEPIAPAMHYQSLKPALLRTLSGLPERPPIALLGCGSVGSKIAMHAARSGQAITAVSDIGHMRPHNMARHALSAGYIGSFKAEALAAEICLLGSKPKVYHGDLAAGLRDDASRPTIVPPDAKMVINATASLSVREALVGTATLPKRVRQFEAALFGRGRVGYLLANGIGNNPNHCDLMAELYATLDDKETSRLLFDPANGLAQVQIGQGCGTLTMPVDDARLSMMSAALAGEIGRITDSPADKGIIVLGTASHDSPATRWEHRLVPAFETVPIQGSDGWQLRLSQRVAEIIRAEARHFSQVETGGVLIGLSSARLKTVTVVDLLSAPLDSKRSASLFVLGTQGLHRSIETRHNASGKTLFDVGTWHSHLVDVGPSKTDWNTAAELAAERTPPSVLLIVTPRSFHALIGNEAENG